MTDERPAFQVIIDLFARHGLERPPTRLRDQLAEYYMAYRDQPQAREEAQPVGGGYDVSDVRYGLHLIANEDCDEVAASYYAKKALAHLYTTPPSQPLAEGADAEKLRGNDK